MDLKEEDILGADIGRHWYYRSKAAALRRAVGGLRPRRLLDIGAGSGFFSRHLLAETAAESALCVDIGYTRECDDSVAGKPVLYRRDTGPTDCDLVLMMDVLEHVDDDRGLLRHYAGKVPAGAHFLVTVPAFRFLWSGHDVFLEHKRRYRLGEIEAAMREAGLEPLIGRHEIVDGRLGDRDYKRKLELNETVSTAIGKAGADPQACGASWFIQPGE